MFKKPVEAKSHQRLSGADRKKLRRTVRNRRPILTDKLLDSILLPKNRVHVYSIEGGCPMFSDIDGRGTEIFPTVFALWEAPEMLPSFMLKGGEVSLYILGGADLMFPGILIPAQGFPSFSAGEIWAVEVPGNQAPIAVGCTTMSSAEALNEVCVGRLYGLLIITLTFSDNQLRGTMFQMRVLWGMWSWRIHLTLLLIQVEIFQALQVG